MNRFNRTFDIVYVVNGKVVETIQSNVHSRALANWIRNERKATGQYRLGLLQVRGSC